MNKSYYSISKLQIRSAVHYSSSNSFNAISGFKRGGNNVIEFWPGKTLLNKQHTNVSDMG